MKHCCKNCEHCSKRNTYLNNYDSVEPINYCYKHSRSLYGINPRKYICDEFNCRLPIFKRLIFIVKDIINEHKELKSECIRNNNLRKV